jgi:polyisoprenyl-phosphate glycosyltransferase
MKDKITVIVPLLNEAENIERLCNELERYFQAHGEFSAEVIFVDDGSTDNSVEMLIKQDRHSYHARIIKLSKNFGSHSALRARILHATGDYITFIYADLQDPLSLIDRLYWECKNGNEISWAERLTKPKGGFNRVFSKTYASLMKRYAIETFPENGFDIVMFNNRVQKILNQRAESNSSIFLEILLLGLRQSTITYNKEPRLAGKSKWTLSKKIKLLIDSFVAFSYAPIRFVTIMGILFSILGFIWTAYIVLRTLLVGDLSAGWPSLIAILLMGFGVTNISLGIIAEYLWRTLDVSRGRPVYIIDEIIELKLS